MNQALDKKNKIGVIIAGLLLAILMASMDNTIVATAMGTIVGEIGGLDKFVWATSAYMVAEMAGMPIFGKLSDMYGRKRFFTFGIVVFMIGSALCGMAESIVQLSMYRAIQGIGAGAMVSIAFTIMFDVVAPENRGKMTGMFGALFGLSSIAAPLLGGYITDYLQWEWIFYINLPLGLIAFLLIVFFYKESTDHARQKIDFLGAFLLVGAIICLMLGVELGGKEYAWGSPQILGMFAGFVVLVILLVFVEKRAAEPIISFRMFRNRLYTTSNMVAMLSGATFMTASMFIPIYIQGVLGGSATNAGLVLLPMMVGSVVTATVGGFLMSKLPYRTILIPTLVILIAGMALLAALTMESPRFLITVYMVLIGLGIGASFSVLSSAAIHSFPATQRGAATSTLNFNRSLGMTLGITIFGIIQSHSLTDKLTKAFGSGGAANMSVDVDFSDPYVLLNPEIRQSMDGKALSTITEGLSSSIIATFAWSLIPAVLALAAAFIMSREKLDPASEADGYAASH
ncbi:MDR family MFS transporter [Paenibacillus eucommiae]|uniref:EmrB/QacA subfamily drug resistance transporter n=1 Tax=Paenibacillus eucommiae TaxID=1355755 RepID=A0ABS4JAP6_9BACL|nr:MDR family MFS transporter [Paenibacillus eucommiae]MBP1996903.1 EmrB/QacA subfamily drug resistance transporter [Paenibacillus eucommiae]